MVGNDDNKMGRWGAISYVLGNIVGAGIFIAPTTISNQVGSVCFFLTKIYEINLGRNIAYYLVIFCINLYNRRLLLFRTGHNCKKIRRRFCLPLLC